MQCDRLNDELGDRDTDKGTEQNITAGRSRIVGLKGERRMMRGLVNRKKRKDVKVRERSVLRSS